MEISAWTRTKPAATDLSHAPPFALGPINVDPPARRISCDTRSNMVEPRVMRVLVALGEAPGRVLSRDDLIELCWDGQVVGDSAITRVVSMLRHTLIDLGGEAVRIETINKVGFRLLIDGQSADSGPFPTADHRHGGSGDALPQADGNLPFWRRKWTRRAAIGGAVVVGAGGAAMAYGFREKIELQLTNAPAAELYRRGQEIQKSGKLGTVRRAMDFYKKAVTIDPSYAPAWAALALSYRHPAQGPPNLAVPSTAQPHLIQEAADRALALEPGNADARLARIATYPFFHHWLERELAARALVTDVPNSANSNSYLGLLMTDVGRVNDGLVFLRRVIQLDPKLAMAWGHLAMALSTAGRVEESQRLLDEASSRWPNHGFLWHARYFTLVNQKRYKEAANFVRDPDGQPDLMGQQGIDLLAGIADALAAGKADKSTVAELICLTCNGLDSAPFAVPMFAQSGAVSEAFDMLNAYYLGGEFNGRRFPPPGVVDQRATFMLFTPPMLALRDDPRFSSLLERVGLEQYWRQSGTQPDFRRS